MTDEGAALVVGATGVTGTPIVEELLTRGWKVYALSRRLPELRAGTPCARIVHLPVDLVDPASAGPALRAVSDVSHIFHCANAGSAPARLRMLELLLAAFEASPRLANINAIQGMKYYGGHLGPFKVPAEETDPRVPGCDFYYAEEDLIMARQAGRAWTWTALRPHSVCGYAAGNPMNLAVVLAIYGSLLAAKGDAFAFPGVAPCFSSLFQVVDDRLLARAAIHVSTTLGCGNRAYNINNGDVFRWHDLWPRLAAFLGLEPAGPTGEMLSDFLGRNADAWAAITRAHALRPFPYERVPHWARGDYTPPNSRLACSYDIVADTGRLRATGFTDVLDSGEMFLGIFQRLVDERVIPTPPRRHHKDDPA